MNVYELWPRFAALFSGLDTAFGTGAGRWVKRPPTPADWVDHLEGRGPGIGIAPLRPDNTVMFAAIDLDEPDFEVARFMQEFIPGPSFVERSRSGNAHVWCFFKEPIEAWIAQGMLKYACHVAGKDHVEVFPKNHDFSKVKLGSYINLPYHGDERPILHNGEEPISLKAFLREAQENLNDPEKWRQRARYLEIPSPEQRDADRVVFGTLPDLHRCAQYVIDHAEENPVVEGHRAVVYFSLAKMLLNCSQYNQAEAFEMMQYVNSFSSIADRVDDAELYRILMSAKNGGYTSTGCDDPTFAPYADPECPLANNRR